MKDIREIIHELELKLKEAMMKSDVKVLDELIADDLIFTNHQGQILSKQDDLKIHQSGQQKLRRFDTTDVQMRVHDSGAIVTFKADLAGTFAHQEFAGSFRYTRVWMKRRGHWQVVALHCSASAA
jgi:ketosteroid isomerase-like protein